MHIWLLVIQGFLFALRKCRYVVYVKAGIYDETVLIEGRMVNVTLYGDGSQKSIITGNKNYVDGVRTFQTASFGKIFKSFDYLEPHDFMLFSSFKS